MKVFEPENKLKLCWDFMILTFLLINVLYIPLNLSFKIQYKSNDSLEEVIRIFLEKIPVIVFLVDIFITLNTAFYQKGKLVYQKFSILKNYYQNFFTLDLITLFPFFLENIINKNSAIKVIFLLRVIKLRNFARKMEESIQLSDKNQYIFEFLKLLFLILYIAHLCGCAWHLLSIWQINCGDSQTWLNLHNLIDQSWEIR